MYPIIFWPFRKRVTAYERSIAASHPQLDPELSRRFNEAVNSPAPEPTRGNADIIRDEMRKLDRHGNKIPSTAVRPGSTPPKAYINNTREILNKAMDKHTDELLALDKDIEKLTEERRQCRIALDGMQAALTHMSAVDASVVPPTEAALDLMAGKVAASAFDDGAE